MLAVLPPIALVGFADTVLDDGARPVYAVVLLCAALAVIFSDGLRRIRQWGPVWSGSRSHRLSPSVKGSRAVAGVVVLAAVLVPGVLPGFRSGPLVDLSTESGQGFDLNGFIPVRQTFHGFPDIPDTQDRPEALVFGDRNDFGPRIGFAWSVPQMRDFVVRG